MNGEVKQFIVLGIFYPFLGSRIIKRAVQAAFYNDKRDGMDF